MSNIVSNNNNTTIYADNNGLIRLFDGTVVYISDYQYSADGISNWEDTFQPFEHINPNNPTQTLPGHKYRRVRHAGDTEYQYPEYIVAKDGIPLILRNNGGVVEWNYEDLSGNWTPLFNLEDYRGARGEKGDTGSGLYINMYGYGIESNNPLNFDGPATTDPNYPNGFLPGERPACSSVLNSSPCGCNDSQKNTSSYFTYMDLNTSRIYVCVNNGWSEITGLVNNNNKVALSTAPTIANYLDLWLNTKVFEIDSTSGLVDLVNTDDNTLGVRFAHVHKDLADESKGLQKGTTGFEAKIDTDTIHFESGAIDVKDAGIQYNHLNTNVANPNKGLELNLATGLEVKVDGTYIGFNGNGELEIIQNSITVDRIAPGQVVTSLNNLHDAVSIVPYVRPGFNHGVYIGVGKSGQNIQISATIDPNTLFKLIPDDFIRGNQLNPDTVANEYGLIVDNANLSGRDRIRIKADGTTIGFDINGNLTLIGSVNWGLMPNNIAVTSITASGGTLQDDVSFIEGKGTGVNLSIAADTVNNRIVFTPSVNQSWFDSRYVQAGVPNVIYWEGLEKSSIDNRTIEDFIKSITDLKADRNSLGEVIFFDSPGVENKKLVLTSVSGNKFHLQVDDSGNLFTTPI